MSVVDKEILNNRQAYHEYIILDKFEAGAVLKGTEVKSIMTGRLLRASFCSGILEWINDRM